MASIHKHSKTYSCVFYWQNGRQWFTVGAVTEAEAHAKASQVEYLLLRLRQRLIELPPGIGIVEFVQFDGKPPTRDVASPAAPRLTLAAFRDRYLGTLSGSLEANTLATTDLPISDEARRLNRARAR